METWDDRQLDKNMQHTQVRKRWADTDLEFFLVLKCLSTGSRSPTPLWNAPPQLGIVSCLSLHLRGSFSIDLFTFLRLAVDLRKDTSCPLTSACRVRRRDICFFCTCARNFGLSVFLSHLTRTIASALLFGDCRLLYLFIYLIIQFPMSRSITLHTFLEINLKFLAVKIKKN